jgi:hypothetical protein
MSILDEPLNNDLQSNKEAMQSLECSLEKTPAASTPEISSAEAIALKQQADAIVLDGSSI